MAQGGKMQIPTILRAAAALAGAEAKEFALGWAAGVMAWQTRAGGASFGQYTVHLTVSDEDYPPGSVRLAAFKAATLFMQTREELKT